MRCPFTFSFVWDIIQECSHQNAMIGWMPTSKDVSRASTLQNNFSKSLILPQKQTKSDMKKKKKILLISLSTLFCVALVLGGWYWYASTTTNPWNAATLGEIPTPMGYKRVEAPAGSYAEFLRALPLKPRGSKVNYYTGGESSLSYTLWCCGGLSFAQ